MAKRTTVAKWLDKYERWQIKVRKDGERKTFTCPTPGREGQRECHKKADAWLEEGLVNPNIKVSALFDQMIEQLKIDTSKTHWRTYEMFGKYYIKPCKGTRRVSELTEQDLKDIITYAYKNPASKKRFKDPAHKKVLSEKTFKDMITCVKYFIKYARGCNITKLYPENLHVPYGAPKSKKGTLLPSDVVKLFTSDKTELRRKEIDEWFIYAWRFAVITGMRPGELSGLESADINQNVCSIKRAINTDFETTDGKNRNARRSFIIPKIGQDILKEQREMLKKARVISPYVFPCDDGTPFKQKYYYQRWQHYKEYNGITDRTPYEMRHTFFSATKRLPAELVKSMGGHGQDFDTFGHYGHELPGEAKETAELVDEVFKKMLSPDTK